MKRFETDAHEARRKNVIDMGLTFSAMIRVFSSGSKEKIITMLSKTLNELPSIETKSDYSKLHEMFCESFSKEISTAFKVLKNGEKKNSRPASFGQAAKVLDIVAKVYVHYSNLPSMDVANKVKPFLNGPIDNPIMDYLKM